jgi:hypothetical protein
LNNTKNQWKKSLFFVKINKLDKHLDKLNKRKIKFKLLKLETINIWEYFENLYSNKVENLEEIEKSLDAYNLPKLNKEDINNLNRSIMSNETEGVFVSQQRKAHDWTDL